MFKKLSLILLLLFCSQVSFGGPGGGSSPADPYLLKPPVIAGTFNVVNAKTSAVTVSANQAINPAIRNLILIGAGQSNMTNSPQAPTYSPANPTKIDQLNILDGGIYNAVDPLLGTSINNYPALGGGNPLTRIADALITANLFDRVICVSIAIDGTAVADWDPALNGVVAARIPVTFARLAAKGFVAGTNVTVAVLWGQGETDTTNGTTQAAYSTSLTNVINASRTAGFTGPWFIAEQTYNTGSISTNVQNAQLAIINHGSNIWAGPDADAIIGTTCGGTCRPDNLHFGSLGMPIYTGASSGWYASLVAFGPPF